MTMPVSDMVRLGTAGQLTNQQLADLALEADREARRQRKPGGDLVKAADADAESARLAALLS